MTARRLAMLSDPARAWRIVRIGTWLDPATGRASRWVVSADGERNVALRVNGREVCCGGERTIRAALARCMWNAASSRQPEHLS